MKIDADLRSSYARQSRRAEKLRALVDEEMRNGKQARWHYESRVKKDESFALKVEAGKSKNPEEMEDVFACVLVVPNFSDVAVAEKFLCGRYDFDYKKPESTGDTRKEPSDFRFDDLRIFVRYRDVPSSPPSGVVGMLFEIQVRTFLQHAWTVATHDSVYKSETLNWRRERIANQVKATLEQAEVTIESILQLELSAVLPLSNARYDAVNDVATNMREHWTREQLPTDVRRLSEGVHRLLALVWGSYASDRFGELLESGRVRYGGSHNLDWSPYRAILQYLTDQDGALVSESLGPSSAGGDLFIYRDILARIGISAGDAPRAILLSGA